MSDRGFSILFFFLVLACNASGVSAQTPAVQVQVYDYTRLNQADLHEFIARTQEILVRSGVSVEVDACPRAASAPCSSHVGGSKQVVIRVVAGVAKNMKNGRWEPLGLSVADHYGGIYASVFRDLAEDEAAEANIPGTILLVYAAVHEIGHLLLGDQSHTPQGLMKAQWEPSDFQAMAQNRFHFRPDQIRELTSRYGVALQEESPAAAAAAVR
jgi:hypothetical protein